MQVRPSEEILIREVQSLEAKRVLCTSVGRAQLAYQYAVQRPDSTVICHFLDVWQAELASDPANPPNLRVVCSADLPSEDCDLFCMPVSLRGDAELTRETLQEGHQRLETEGLMIAATDNPTDSWLYDEMRKLFPKVSRRPHPEGIAYLATKQSSLKKEKRFACEYAFRDHHRLIYVTSRPGVFSHRHLDVGSRALIESVQIRPGMRVLELGCGAGAVSFACALRAEQVDVTAIDSNARAVECTRRGARRNGIERLTVRLDARADVEPGCYDLVVANPPYYSGFRITELFLKGAERALVSRGIALFVTKHPQSYEDRIPEGFVEAYADPVRNYHIIRAVRG